MRIGLLTSIPRTVDAFFQPWIDRWRAAGIGVSAAAGPMATGSPSGYVDTLIPGLGQSPGPRSALAARSLRRWVRDERLDVILTSTATASAVVRTANVPCPVVYFCHGLHWAEPPIPASGRFARFVETRLVPRTDGVITMNGHDRKWFEEEAPSVPHVHLDAGIGLDLDEWTLTNRTAGSDDGTLRLVWVGDFSARKRPADAAALMRWLRVRDVDASLTMLGDGPLLAATQHACDPSLNIVFAGRSPSRPHLAEAHALVHTAAWEGMSRVLLESSALGIPSFGYAVKGVQDCPGTRTAGRAGDVPALGATVMQWAENGRMPPQLERASLDWRLAHDRVTHLLQETARQG